MYEKRDFLGLLNFLLSFLILMDLFILYGFLPNISGVTLTLIIIVMAVLACLSLIVSLHDNHPKRFLYIFWNPILGGIIGTYAFYLWIDTPTTFSIKEIFYLILIVYSVGTIYYSDVLARAFKMKKRYK